MVIVLNILNVPQVTEQLFTLLNGKKKEYCLFAET